MQFGILRILVRHHGKPTLAILRRHQADEQSIDILTLKVEDLHEEDNSDRGKKKEAIMSVLGSLSTCRRQMYPER